MPIGTAVALALLVDASAAQADAGNGQTAVGAEKTYGPPAPPKPAKKKPAADTCETPAPDASTREIVVCAQRPNGYRINPDIMEAKREMRSGGAPKQHDKIDPKECAVGPFGCNYLGGGINVIAAATTLATMAKRLSDGKEIGSMFQTTPTPSEYQLYLAAKKRREAKEKAEAAAEAEKAKAGQAAAGSGQPAPAQSDATAPQPSPQPTGAPAAISPNP
jgi:hypothetical protein